MSTKQLSTNSLSESSLATLLKANIRTYAMILGLIVLCVLFTITTNGLFLNVGNLSNLTRQMAIYGILGTGMILVIISGNGNIDLSVGSVLGFVGCLGGWMMITNGWGVIPSIIVLLIVGAVIGLIQGFIIAQLQVPAFIVTLGGMMLYRGASYVAVGGITIAPFPESYKIISENYLDKSLGAIFALLAVVLFIAVIINKRVSSKKFGLRLESKRATIMKVVGFTVLLLGFVHIMNGYRGINVPVIILLVVVLIFTFIANQTKFGRNIYSIGGNMEAAEYAGIKIKKVVMLVFMLNGFIAAIAGIIYSSRLNAATPVGGETMELDAIAAAIIGGASMAGGSGAVPGALLGAIVIATLDNGMSLLNANVFWQLIVKGLVVIAAVWFDSYTKRKVK